MQEAVQEVVAVQEAARLKERDDAELYLIPRANVQLQLSSLLDVFSTCFHTFILVMAALLSCFAPPMSYSTEIIIIMLMLYDCSSMA